MSRLCTLFQQHANCYQLSAVQQGDWRDHKKAHDIWDAVEGDRDRAILFTDRGSDKHSGHFEQHSEHLGWQLASCSPSPIMSDWRYCMLGRIV